MQSQGTRLYRVKAVAEIFDVSTGTIYRAIKSGHLTALKFGDGRGTVRIPEDAVNAYRDAANRRAVEEHTEPEVTAEEWLAGTPSFRWPGGVCPLEACWPAADDGVVSGEVD